MRQSTSILLALFVISGASFATQNPNKEKPLYSKNEHSHSAKPSKDLAVPPPPESRQKTATKVKSQPMPKSGAGSGKASSADHQLEQMEKQTAKMNQQAAHANTVKTKKVSAVEPEHAPKKESLNAAPHHANTDHTHSNRSGASHHGHRL